MSSKLVNVYVAEGRFNDALFGRNQYFLVHFIQGSCSTLPSVPSSWSRGSKITHFLPTVLPVCRKDRLLSLKCRSHAR